MRTGCAKARMVRGSVMSRRSAGPWLGLVLATVSSLSAATICVGRRFGVAVIGLVGSAGEEGPDVGRREPETNRSLAGAQSCGLFLNAPNPRPSGPSRHCARQDRDCPRVAVRLPAARRPSWTESPSRRVLGSLGSNSLPFFTRSLVTRVVVTRDLVKV